VLGFLLMQFTHPIWSGVVVLEIRSIVSGRLILQLVPKPLVSDWLIASDCTFSGYIVGCGSVIQDLFVSAKC